MAKRKDESFSPSTAVLERSGGDHVSIYSPEYSGRIWWLLGIRIDEERNQIPLHNAAFGGIPWQQGTQREVAVQEGWTGLEIHRLRLTPQLLFAHQVRRAVKEIKQKVVRWQSRKLRGWKADVLSLEHRIKTFDPEKRKHVPSGYRYQPGRSDEPLSKYLVFISRKKLRESSGQSYEELDVKKIPTMLELDPSLIPDRMSGEEENIAAGDEPW